MRGSAAAAVDVLPVAGAPGARLLSTLPAADLLQLLPVLSWMSVNLVPGCRAAIDNSPGVHRRACRSTATALPWLSGRRLRADPQLLR
ncbi:hypothetical protein GC101_27000 [Paenibacillus sp. LMG 31459]|uniref:Uncharacterized protein n=1 Tax=Paenibacillus phytohabitans TaxID=2654978 RepID=A0ABX1YNR3_9BACL|nr:hypothetical protein [Paenibacillus phytohabitans]